MESQISPHQDSLFREESVPLVIFNNTTKKFEVCQEAIDMISQVKAPLGVITVAGMYRTGKSYLLNRMLLNRQKGFGVGPSINPCTKGLWVWGTPLTGFSPDGNPLNILVIDSEGIGGLDEDNNHDMRIFSLALLLASYFLYNSNGSIDENALSNLSLVVNLTKHIQFKSQSTNEIDMNRLLEYLPSFMWVVRDFALQLVDENQNEISSRDYLERALQEKGNDQKNEIRQHLKKFFRDRECCTMIRPLTNEDELQNLEHMELEELRAEFVEQVMHLRRKVINRIKPKTVNGQCMDGSMWISLVQQYVKAINDGVVPDIQSSWSYICRQKAQQTLDATKEAFDKEVQDSISLPMNHSELEKTVVLIRKGLVQHFNKQIKGEPELTSEYQQELDLWLYTKTSQLMANNLDECRKFASDLLNQLFSEVEQSIKCTEAKMDIEQLDLTLKQLSGFYDSNAYEFDEKQILLSDAKVFFLADILHYYTKNYESELKVQKQLECQSKERLEQQIREAKEESRMERIKLEDSLRQAMLDKSELEANHQFIKEQYEIFKQNKDEEDKEYKTQIYSLKELQNQAQEELRTQKEEFEDKIQSLQREQLKFQSEFDKEKALFEQQVSYLEKTLKEKADKERDYMSEFQSQKSEMSGELKTICSKYEQDLKSLTRELEEARERNHEIEVLLKEKEHLLVEKEVQWSKIETQYKIMIQTAQDQQKLMESTLNSVRKESEKQYSQQNKEKDVRVEQFVQQIQELENTLKDTSEQLKNKENEFKKERAVKDQKLEFLEMQLKETRDQLEETYRQHENMVKAMKQENSPVSKRPDHLPNELDSLQAELIKQSEDYELQIKSLKQSLEVYQEKVSESELQLKLQQSDYVREVKELKTQINEIDGVKQMLNEKVKVLEQQKGKLIEEADKKYKKAVQSFEDELEEKEQKVQQELRDMQDKSEESLAQLKNFYEIEKEKLEQRIAEERDKGTRRMHNYQEEQEIRMREELAEKEEEIECLQNELREWDARHQKYVSQMEHEVSLKLQLIHGLERQVRDAKERVEMLELGRNSAFEKQIEHFENQRQEYNQKIDKLQLDNLDKDRQLASLQHKLERLMEDLERKKHDYETHKQHFDKEKKSLQNKMDTNKKKLQDAQDEAMQFKLEAGREQALQKQQIEFMGKKIEEMQKSAEENQKFFDEKIKSYKQDVQNEVQAQIDRINSEKDLYENKYEQKRKALKELESSVNKQNHELEKKINTLQSSVERLEEEKRQIEENYEQQIAHLENQIQELDSNAGAAYFYGSAHAEDVMKLKNEVQDLERELSDLQSTYDRDKALWEGKCQFLEQQKETYKRDLMESQKKFEITLEQLQKRGSLDKDKFENNQSALIKVIESKYKSQIKEMLDTHQCLQNEGQSKVKRLEGEIKMLNERLQLETRGKMSEYGSLEKRVQELTENDKKMQAELEEVKMERDRRVQDYQKQLDKEKEIYKQRLTEYEQKAKESENRRVALIFEFEKERAKWQLERDNLMSQKTEMSEAIERLSTRKDQLLRENEKLRNENKGNKKYLFQNSSATNSMQSSSSHSSASATRYMIAKSLSGQGDPAAQYMNQVNKMKENSKFIGSGDSSGANSKDATPTSKQHRYGH